MKSSARVSADSPRASASTPEISTWASRLLPIFLARRASSSFSFTRERSSKIGFQRVMVASPRRGRALRGEKLQVNGTGAAEKPKSFLRRERQDRREKPDQPVEDAVHDRLRRAPSQARRRVAIKPVLQHVHIQGGEVDRAKLGSRPGKPAENRSRDRPPAPRARAPRTARGCTRRVRSMFSGVTASCAGSKSARLPSRMRRVLRIER